MQDPRIRKYNKKFWYSYAMGTYPTIDLLKYKPEKVSKVLISRKGEKSEGISEVLKLCKEKNINYEYNDNHIQHIAVKENTYCVGIFQKYEDELDKESDHIVLDQPRNMGNIGTIIRTMVGFNFKDLAIIKPAADIFDPMIVRSAMGAMFQIRFSYFDTYEQYLKQYPKHKQYLTMLDGAKDISKVEFENPFTLVLGNESSGLPSSYSQYGTTVFIPHSKDIDSLNLSIAAGISMYLTRKEK